MQQKENHALRVQSIPSMILRIKRFATMDNTLAMAGVIPVWLALCALVELIPSIQLTYPKMEVMNAQLVIIALLARLNLQLAH